MQQRGVGRAGSFGLMKFVSWGTLVLILLASLFLSIFLANYARQVLLEKQQEFAKFWAETLDNNITRRFSIPVAYMFGEVNLTKPEQYKRLDDVVGSVLKDFPVQALRIYDLNGVVGYALDRSLLGKEGLGGEAVSQAMAESKFSYDFIYQTGPLGALFSPHAAPGSVVMRTVAPLRFKGTFPGGRIAPDDSSGGQEGQQDEGAETVSVDEIIGALEFTQDITADYQKLITFQRIIILSNLVSALVIFFILRMLIHRADRINTQRMREKEEFEREMAQNEKLVSMGRMVAGIAHEIRNPLGIIRSSAELLVSRLKDKDPLTARILAAIHEEAVRLSKTVGDFLDYARPKALKLEPVDLSFLLDQALTFLEQKCLEQGVEVVRQYAPGVIVQADKDLLYRAVYNILVNALEAMTGQPEGEEDGVKGQIVIQASVNDDEVKLSILDTGPGIPDSIRDKLLDPFFTTKESGTGLGLAITANILRSHGASLSLGDNPEGGARVDISFART